MGLIRQVGVAAGDRAPEDEEPLSALVRQSMHVGVVHFHNADDYELAVRERVERGEHLGGVVESCQDQALSEFGRRVVCREIGIDRASDIYASSRYFIRPL